MTRILTEKKLHLTFKISILLKGFYALIEILSGLLFLVDKTLLILGVRLLTLGELGEDPKDLLANYVLRYASELSFSTQHFLALYLISHGVIKLFVIIGLLKKKVWAYPASVLIFSGFIIYQLYRYSHTHSPWLLLFTLFDVIVICLAIREWKQSSMHRF